MSVRRIILMSGLLLAVGLAGVVGAVAGGGAVYWAVQDRLNALTAASPPASTPIAPPQPAPQTVNVDINSAVQEAVAKVGPAVVTVENVGVGSGSGVILTSDGYILTNQHVVEDGQRYRVIFRDGQTASAELVGAEGTFSDVAVLKVNVAVPGVATLGDSDRLQPGETVIAIGSPLGDFRNTVTVGVVSATGRSIETDTNFKMEDLLQTDAAINHGNSGGPLVNLAGQVIGINTLMVRGGSFASDQAQGLGFAIAANTVKSIADQLIAKGYVSHPYLGIQPITLTPDVAEMNGLPVQWGVYVRTVLEGTPAAQAGLQPGDIITQIGDTPIDDNHRYLNALQQYEPGQNVALTVRRGSDTLTLQVTLGERPHSG